MARDSSGPKNEPNYSGLGTPSDAADLTEVATYAARVGNRRADTNANRTSAAGADVWTGLEWFETDTGSTYVYNSGWVLESAPDTGWISPTLSNSWVNFGGSYATAQYRRLDGVVYIKGVIKSGTITTGTTLFTLPAGFRTTEQRLFPTQANTTIATVTLTAAGALQCSAVGSNASLSIEFSYPADA